MASLFKTLLELKDNTLFRVILACFIVGLVHLFFDGDTAWYVYAAGLIAQQMIAFMVLFSYISYEKLKDKTLAAMLCVFPFLEIALLFTHNPYGIAFIVASTLSVMWLMWAVFRRYDVTSDTLDSEYVYAIAKPPNSFITFLAALVKMFGRYSYYVNGSVFHYHKDYFIMTPADRFPMTDATIIRTKVRATKEVHDALTNSIGTKWGWWNNCLTVMRYV